MAVRKWANNYSSTLNGAITNVQTTIIVNDDTGLPAIGAGEEYNLTITDGTNIEIVTVTDDASTPTLTVTRGVEGTSGTAFADGSTVELRDTAASKTDVLSGDESPQLRGDLDLDGNTITDDSGGNVTIDAAASKDIDFQVNGTDVLKINSSGELLVGLTSSPTNAAFTFLDSGNDILVVTNSETNSANKSGRYGVNHYTNSEEPLIGLFCNTTSTENIVNIGGGTAAGNSSTSVRIYCASGTTTLTGSEILRVTTSGISFDAGTNYLDDYEEGTFTPTVTFGTPGDLSVSYSSQLGDYIKIGNLIIAKVNVTCVPTFTTATGPLRVDSLPFSAYRSWGGVLQNQQGLTWAGYSFIAPTISNAQTYVQMIGLSSGSSGANSLQETEVTSGATLQIAFNLYYWET